LSHFAFPGDAHKAIVKDDLGTSKSSLGGLVITVLEPGAALFRQQVNVHNSSEPGKMVMNSSDIAEFWWDFVDNQSSAAARRSSGRCLEPL
jgi:hypothetical protein